MSPDYRRTKEGVILDRKIYIFDYEYIMKQIRN